jgi:hypothetical protein
MSNGGWAAFNRTWQAGAHEIAAPHPHPILSHAMVVIALTAFVGLALVTFFIVLFISYAVSGGGIEHEALLPLEDETPATVLPRQN